MRAQVTKIEEHPSKYGSKFFYIFFRNLEGKSYKTCIHVVCRNFKNWTHVLNKAKDNPWLDGLELSNREANLITADSTPRVIEPINAPEIISKQPPVIQQPLFSDYDGARKKLHEAMATVGGK